MEPWVHTGWREPLIILHTAHFYWSQNHRIQDVYAFIHFNTTVFQHASMGVCHKVNCGILMWRAISSIHAIPYETNLTLTFPDPLTCLLPSMQSRLKVD